MFSQFSGIDVIMYYGTELLKTSEFSADSAIIADTLNGVVSMIGVTLAVMITHLFRRRVMIILAGLLSDDLPPRPGRALRPVCS